MPNCCKYSILCCNNVLPFTSASALGCLSVKGFKRVPRPAAKSMAFMYGVLYALVVWLHRAKVCKNSFTTRWQILADEAGQRYYHSAVAG